MKKFFFTLVIGLIFLSGCSDYDLKLEKKDAIKPFDLPFNPTNEEIQNKLETFLSEDILDCTGNEECFYESIQNCEKSKFSQNLLGSNQTSVIAGSIENNCNIFIKEETPDGVFYGYCSYPKESVSAYLHSDKGLVTFCSGSWKDYAIKQSHTCRGFDKLVYKDHLVDEDGSLVVTLKNATGSPIAIREVVYGNYFNEKSMFGKAFNSINPVTIGKEFVLSSEPGVVSILKGYSGNVKVTYLNETSGLLHTETGECTDGISN